MAALVGSRGKGRRSLLPLCSCPLLVAFCLKVTDDALVPCPGDQTLLRKVGEEGKDPPGQSWERHLDLCPLKEGKAGRLSPLTSQFKTHRCSCFLLMQSWANTAIKGLTVEYRTVQMGTGSLKFTPPIRKIIWK